MNKNISEAVKIDDNVKTKLGERLMELFGLLGKNKSIEFTLMSGTKIVLRCIKAAEPNFVFEVLLDDKKFLCKWDNLQLMLKIGNKNDKNPIGKYNLNQNVIKPSNKKEDAFTLVFVSTNEKGEKGKSNFNNIINIAQSSLSEDKTKCNETEPEEPKKPESDSQDEVNSIDPKALYDSIVNDPVMKTAFYKQPSLWNYLVAIVKGEKPRGSGLVSAADIVSDYRQSKIAREIGPDFDNFVDNKELTYEILSPQEIVFEPSTEGGQQITYKINNEYPAKVLPIGFDAKYRTLVDKKTGVSIIITSKNKKQRTEYPFNVSFVKKYDTGEKKEYEAVIDIKNVKGSGFYKEEEENNK
jgi:hypothetical protein